MSASPAGVQRTRGVYRSMHVFRQGGGGRRLEMELRFGMVERGWAREVVEIRSVRRRGREREKGGG